MRNSLERLDQFYINKNKSAAYKQMLDQQIQFNRRNRPTNGYSPYEQDDREKQQKNNQIAQDYYGKNINRRLETLESKYIPVSNMYNRQRRQAHNAYNAYNNRNNRNPYPVQYNQNQDSDTDTQKYLSECERLIQNLKNLNKHQQLKLKKKKHGSQILSLNKNNKDLLASYNKQTNAYNPITNQESRFFDSQNSFKNYYRSKSYDIRPVYKGLKDKINQNYEQQRSGKAPKNNKLNPLARSESYNSSQIKKRHLQNSGRSQSNDISEFLFEKYQNSKQRKDKSNRKQGISQRKGKQEQKKSLNEENESYQDSDTEYQLNESQIKYQSKNATNKRIITQNPNQIKRQTQNKPLSNNPEQKQEDKLQKLNKLLPSYKRQNVLKHLKVAKKKGSILFKKIQEFKKNRQIQLQKTFPNKFKKQKFQEESAQKTNKQTTDKNLKLNQGQKQVQDNSAVLQSFKQELKVQNQVSEAYKNNDLLNFSEEKGKQQQKQKQKIFNSIGKIQSKNLQQQQMIKSEELLSIHNQQSLQVDQQHKPCKQNKQKNGQQDHKNNETIQNTETQKEKQKDLTKKQGQIQKQTQSINQQLYQLQKEEHYSTGAQEPSKESQIKIKELHDIQKEQSINLQINTQTANKVQILPENEQKPFLNSIENEDEQKQEQNKQTQNKQMLNNASQEISKNQDNFSQNLREKQSLYQHTQRMKQSQKQQSLENYPQQQVHKQNVAQENKFNPSKQIVKSAQDLIK